MMLVLAAVVLVPLLAAYVAVRLIVRAQAHDRFPTGEPRGPVHFHGAHTSAELMKAMAPGQQPKGKP